jgi:L-threonylcarbamoyladenylate synthase
VIVDVEKGASLLARARVVAYPTETVYGLGADASSGEALDHLHGLKGREERRGLSVLVTGPEALERLAPTLPERAGTLARHFWPGPLTLVVPVDDPRFDRVRTEHGVGLRCSAHPTAAALARAASCPVVSTSCNRSGATPCRSAAEVERVFGANLAIVEGGAAGGLEPSTVVAVDANGELELLREGAVPFDEILNRG